MEALVAKRSSLLALAGFGAATAAAAWYGARYSPRDSETRRWYSRLDKPRLNPPDAVFPAVWTSLYTLMAISGYRVWQTEDSPERSRALRLWATQLAANAKWTKLFFGKHRLDLALADIVTLETTILAYISTANKVDRTASAAFIPYAAWVAFAAYLNAEIARKNPDARSLRPRAA
jgi:tryptophan-rich sensory protein